MHRTQIITYKYFLYIPLYGDGDDYHRGDNGAVL